jgi:aryl sulfotransferase
MHSSVFRYRSTVSDSRRWDGFAFRDDDIVISAPPKCGTTWVQMICALLIFRNRTIPSTMDIVSPWLDMLMRPLSDVVRDLETQQHRRFVKTHTPLDGLPFDERVTYICIGRDPRDAAVSLKNHMANLDVNAFLAALNSEIDPDIFDELVSNTLRARAEALCDWFRKWVDASAAPGLCALVRHLATFWDAREYPNVVLLHYNDLKIDLRGQMRELATRLDLKISEEVWPDLVQAATFAEMRKHADKIVPNATAGLWHNNARFFNEGENGQWKGFLKTEDVRLYEARVRELAKPDLAAWLHQERQ